MNRLFLTKYTLALFVLSLALILSGVIYIVCFPFLLLADLLVNYDLMEDVNRSIFRYLTIWDLPLAEEEEYIIEVEEFVDTPKKEGDPSRS